MVEDAPEAFDPNYSDPDEEPGVAKFAKLICGTDVVYHGYHEDNDHGDNHWEHDDDGDHWDDHWEHDDDGDHGDDHWEHDDDSDHGDDHWEHNDHDWNLNFYGADLGCKPSKGGNSDFEGFLGNVPPELEMRLNFLKC